jgi:hypothetical protein
MPNYKNNVVSRLAVSAAKSNVRRIGKYSHK